MHAIFKKGLRSWSKIKTVITYRKLIRASIKTFKPILRITNKRVMRYVSMVTIFTMAFGLIFWSTDFNIAYADSTSVGASKDGWVDQAATSENHGNNSELKVKSKNNSDNRRLLLEFNLPSLPSGYVIDSATLILYMQNAPSDDRTYGVYRVTGSDWIEGNGGHDNNPSGELTWSNKPSTVASSSSTVTTGTSNNVYKSWDVTSDVSGMYNSSYNNYGWTIKDEAENNSQSREGKFRSKEHSDSTQRPKLEISYHIAPQGSISGYKFNDLDGDGFWDQEGENLEPGLANWTITLSNGDEVTSDENGYYIFEGLENDDYVVCEEMGADEDSWSQTYPNIDSENIADADIYEFCDEESDSFGKYGYEVEIDEDRAEEVNFGNVQYGSITIQKITDPEEVNPDNEAGGFEFTVTGQEDSVVESGDSTTYNDLIAGTYDVQEIVPEGWSLSGVSCVYDDESVGQDIENGKTVVLDAGDDVTCTFTNTKLGTITVYKFNDLDNGGDLDRGEPALENWTMALGRVGTRPQPEQPASTDNQIPIEIVAMSLTGVDGSVRFKVDQPGDYKAFEAQQDGWSVTSPGHIDSFFDITYDLKSIAEGDPDFDLLSIGDPDFDLLRSSFFDIFVELSGQEVSYDNQENPLRFLNHLPSPTPTPTPTPSESPEPISTPTPTPENNGGGSGGGGGSPGGIIIDGPGANPPSSSGGTVAGASTTPTPNPTPTSTSSPSGSTSGGGSSSSGNSGGGEPSPTPEVMGESPTPTPSETLTPSESPSPEGSNLFAEFLNSLPDSWVWLLPLFVLIALFFIWLSRRS